jgi:hypothetical protein
MKIFWFLVIGCWGVAVADPWYNTNALTYSRDVPGGVFDGKIYRELPQRALMPLGWVQLTGGRAAWYIDGATARPKTAAELLAEADAAAVSAAIVAAMQARREQSEAAVGIYEPVEVIAALAKIQNARINAIIDRIITINPASSNTLSRARLTNAELKQAIREELGD